MSTEAGAPAEPLDVATQSLARPAAVMAVGTALSRLTGLGRVVAAAYALGVTESRLADSYNIANTLPNVVYELILGGVLTSVFIPVVIEQLRTKDSDEAWRAVSAMVSTALAVLAVLTLVTVAIAPFIIDLFTTRVSGAQAAQQHDLATFFLRVFAPQIALYGFAAIAAGLLNAHGRFAVPMFVPILNNLVVIGAFLAFAALSTGVPSNGSVNDDTGLKLLLGLGTTGGVLAMAAIYVPYLRSLPGRLRARMDFRHPAVRKLARLSAWTLGYVVTNTIGFFISFYLANGKQGGVTAYVTAYAFFQLPIGIAGVSIMTALVPKLSAHFVDGDRQLFRARLSGGIATTAILLVPATAAYLVLGRPLIQALLEHGVVRSGSVDLVSSVLALFAIGLLPFSAYSILMRAFYTRQDARSPALINIAENGVTIALDFALFPSLGVKGLALAHTLGYVAGCAVAVARLRGPVGGLGGRELARDLGNVTVAAAVCAGVMGAIVALTDSAMSAGDTRALVQLVVGGGAGLGAFLLAANALKVRDLDVFKRLLPARFR
ncbi:MAG TPA: murein biosynthesis integral membrane protein MurJ [Solirubrobacteraceae bacterium]